MKLGHRLTLSQMQNSATEGMLPLIATYTLPSNSDHRDITIPAGYGWVEIRFAGVGSASGTTTMAYSLSIDAGATVDAPSDFRYGSLTNNVAAQTAGIIYLGFGTGGTNFFTPDSGRPGGFLVGRVNLVRMETHDTANFNGTGAIWVHGLL